MGSPPQLMPVGSFHIIAAPPIAPTAMKSVSIFRKVFIMRTKITPYTWGLRPAHLAGLSRVLFVAYSSRLFLVLGVYANGYRTVVREGYFHIGPELTGTNRLANSGRKGRAELLIQRNGQFVTGSANI